jgi:hypothetical protein
VELGVRKFRSNVKLPLAAVAHSEDKAEYRDLAIRLCTRTKYPVVVPNYRLTRNQQANFQHPRHAEDLLQFLEFLRVYNGPDLAQRGPIFNQGFYLMGHSCAAHMLSAVILDSSATSPSLTPSLHLLEAIQGVILSEGIYDIDLLLENFPDYREWFIASVFGSRDAYAPYSVTSYSLRRDTANWLLIQSKGDTLIDMAQCQAMHRHLCMNYGERSPAKVTVETDRLDGGHNDILHTETFVDITTEFIEEVERSRSSM